MLPDRRDANGTSGVAGTRAIRGFPMVRLPLPHHNGG